MPCVDKWLTPRLVQAYKVAVAETAAQLAALLPAVDAGPVPVLPAPARVPGWQGAGRRRLRVAGAQVLQALTAALPKGCIGCLMALESGGSDGATSCASSTLSAPLTRLCIAVLTHMLAARPPASRPSEAEHLLHLSPEFFCPPEPAARLAPQCGWPRAVLVGPALLRLCCLADGVAVAVLLADPAAPPIAAAVAASLRPDAAAPAGFASLSGATLFSVQFVSKPRAPSLT